MTTLKQLENKIRESIPELKEEFEVFQEGAIDSDMITPVMLNHVLEYLRNYGGYSVNSHGYWVCWYLNDGGEDNFLDFPNDVPWNLKSAYLKHQSPELINFLNELK